MWEIAEFSHSLYVVHSCLIMNSVMSLDLYMLLFSEIHSVRLRTVSCFLCYLLGWLRECRLSNCEKNWWRRSRESGLGDNDGDAQPCFYSVRLCSLIHPIDISRSSLYGRLTKYCRNFIKQERGRVTRSLRTWMVVSERIAFSSLIFPMLAASPCETQLLRALFPHLCVHYDD